MEQTTSLESAHGRRVRQANALAKSGQELHVIEKRLLFITISRIRRSDTELLTHRIPMTELEPHFGGNPYRAANKAATGLLRRVVTVREEDGGFTAFNWTTLARYVPASQSDDGNAYIEIRLNEELKPFLLQLQNRYNTIPLGDVLPMSSTNSQRLYEILWHDSFAGDKTLLTYDIADLKFQLGLRRRVNEKGKQVWREKYAQWRDFQKVLSRAKEDFVEHGRLRYDFEGLKQGRQTTQVRFRLWTESEEALPEVPTDLPAPDELELLEQLELAGYLQDPLKTVRSYGSEVVAQALKLALDAERKAAQTSNPVQNLGGLIHHTLTTGLAKRSLERDDLGPPVQPRSLAQTLADTFGHARATWADAHWVALSETAQADLREVMRLELPEIQITLLDRQNWQGAAFDMARREVILKLNAEALPQGLMDLNSFVAEEGLLMELEDAAREGVLQAAYELL